MKSLRSVYAAFAVKLSLLTIIGDLGSANCQQCMNFNSSFLSNTCGYNHTVKFQNKKSFDLGVEEIQIFKSMFGSCSEYSNLMSCSVVMPRCKEDLYGPYLPCKRVCIEFAKDCRARGVKEDVLQLIVENCHLLPEFDKPTTNKGYLGRCFEPPNFKSSLGDGYLIKCSKLVVPMCQGLGYDETLASETEQITRWLPLLTSVDYTADKKCGELRKLFDCVRDVQPCKNNKPQTLCRHQCEKIVETCNIHVPHFNRSDCEKTFPEGNLSSTLCYRHKDWPGFQYWPKPIASTLEVPSAARTVASKSETLKVAIVVPLSFALILTLAFVLLFFYRKRQARQRDNEEQAAMYGAEELDINDQNDEMQL